MYSVLAIVQFIIYVQAVSVLFLFTLYEYINLVKFFLFNLFSTLVIKSHDRSFTADPPPLPTIQIQIMRTC